MSKALLFLCALLYLSPSLAIVRIGNGGEGIIGSDSSGKGVYYVRDLYEVGSHINPWFGYEISPVLAKMWNQGPLAHRFLTEKNLMLIKLTDIENFYPGLGVLTLMALSQYDLKFVPSLERLPEDPEPYGGRRVQIAIRLQDTIFMAGNVWHNMRKDAKVSLLIHEAIYSLAKVHCTFRSEYCRQLATDIRPIVGYFFHQNPHPDLALWIPNFLDVKSLKNTCDVKIPVTVQDTKGLEFTENYLPGSNIQTAQKICGKIKEFPIEEFKIQSTKTFNNLKKVGYLLRSDQGGTKQLGYKFEVLSKPASWQLKLKDSNDCQLQVENLLKDLYAFSIGGKPEKSVDIPLMCAK